MSVIGRGELLLRAKNYSGSGNWLDESGNGHDATPVSSPTFNDTYFTLNGTDHFTVADAAGLDFAETDDLTVMVRARTADVTPASDSILLAKKLGTTGAGAGYNIMLATTGTMNFRIADGAVSSNDAKGASLINDVIFVAAGVRNTGDDDIEVFVDGVGSGSPTTDATTVTLANALTLNIGASSSPGNYSAVDVFDVVLWRPPALTPAEVAQAGLELQTWRDPLLLGII